MTHQLSVRYRFLRDGLPGKPHLRFFHNARDAHHFLSSLNALDGPQVVEISVAKRTIGPWEFVDRLAVESMAAGEEESR